MKEEAVLFGQTGSLVGIVTGPSETETTNRFPAVILLSPGRVHHVGPYRLYVRLARNLAAMGLTVFRFDLSGIGDSGIRTDHLPFDQSAVIETQEAMSYLQATRKVDRFILIGICSGAGISYRTALCDSRVMGAVLISASINLYGNDDVLSNYIERCGKIRYGWRLLRSSRIEDWVRLVVERLDFKKIIQICMTMVIGVWYQMERLLWNRKRESAYINKCEADFRVLNERGVHLFLINSENDFLGAEYHNMLINKQTYPMEAEAELQVELVKGSDYNLSLNKNQEHLLKIILNRIQGFIELCQSPFHHQRNSE
ncbi:MAG: alpha/beta hydrolase [Deltaproteobacteria bacterium]|nr:alpha/beta hydrolase [Deltaproteobacteria bacterium]